MGCLVTKEKTPPVEADCPPSIEDVESSRTPLNRVLHINLEDYDAPDAGQSELVFEAKVRDCNATENLVWQRFTDFRAEFGGSAPVNGGPLQPGERDTFSFRLPVDELRDAAPACHKIELLVSGGFQNFFPFRTPLATGDLGSAVWWVAVTNNASEVVDMTTCP